MHELDLGSEEVHVPTAPALAVQEEENDFPGPGFLQGRRHFLSCERKEGKKKNRYSLDQRPAVPCHSTPLGRWVESMRRYPDTVMSVARHQTLDGLGPATVAGGAIGFTTTSYVGRFPWISE